MKSELRLRPHEVLDGHLVIEVWHGSRMVAVVYGADGPGVRVISKHGLRSVIEPTTLGGNSTAVMVDS